MTKSIIFYHELAKTFNAFAAYVSFSFRRKRESVYYSKFCSK